jgi:hypothetical protein
MVSRLWKYGNEKVRNTLYMFKVYILITYLDENIKHWNRLLKFDNSIPNPYKGLVDSLDLTY